MVAEQVVRELFWQPYQQEIIRLLLELVEVGLLVTLQEELLVQILLLVILHHLEVVAVDHKQIKLLEQLVVLAAVVV